jgi:thiol-disulfide isomerase/thioredoxin
MKALTYILVALAAGAAGFAIYRFGIEPVAAPQAQSQTVSVPVAPTPIPTRQAPDVLPEFTLTDLEGQPRSIRSWPGKSMIVNFWATWCAPCRREIPLLNELQKLHGDEGFQVVGVAVDVPEEVLQFAKDIGIEYPVIMGEQDGLEAAGKFGLVSIGFPFTVFTDSQHRIVLTHLGELHKPQADVIMSIVARVNAGELTPSAARSMAAAQLEQLDIPEA